MAFQTGGEVKKPFQQGGEITGQAQPDVPEVSQKAVDLLFSLKSR